MQPADELGEVPLYGKISIVLGHRISVKGREVDEENIEVVGKL